MPLRENLVVNNKDNRVLRLGTIGLIVAPWKFDVLKTSIFRFSGKYLFYKNIKFPRGNYQLIVPRSYCLIDHFTVVGLVTWPLNGSEAGVDLVLIQTSLFLFCKSSCSYANQFAFL